MFTKLVVLFSLYYLCFCQFDVDTKGDVGVENHRKKYTCPLVCVNNLYKNMTVEIGMIRCTNDHTMLNVAQERLTGIKNVCANVGLNQSVIFLTKADGQENAQTQTIQGHTQVTCTFVGQPLCFFDPMQNYDKFFY